MALNIDDLPKEAQQRLKKEHKIRVRPSGDIVKRHALAVCSILMDNRGLSTKDARKVLTKAMALLK